MAKENTKELESLDYHSSLCKCPACGTPQEARENFTPIIEPKAKAENKESVGEPPEQPNQLLMIIQTIQGLMTCVNDNFDKLCVLGSDTPERKKLIAKALEDVDMFEKTTLFDLQKAFE